MAVPPPFPALRAPLIYTGDPQASLDRLHSDVVQHYRMLSAQLGEHERHDLTTDPPPLITGGMGYGRLSLAPSARNPEAVGGYSAASLLRLPDAPGAGGLGVGGPSGAYAGYGAGGDDLLGGGGGVLGGAGFGPRAGPSAFFGGQGTRAAGGLRQPGMGGYDAGGYGRPQGASAPAGLSWDQPAGGVRASGFAIGAVSGFNHVCLDHGIRPCRPLGSLKQPTDCFLEALIS